MKRAALSLVFLLLPAAAPAADALMERARGRFEPIPPNPPVLAGNPATPEKIELGKMLFFDPRLSSSWLISCNTCHNVGLGGVDLLETSIGHGWAQGPRNSPTVLNAVFNVAQFWDGRAKNLMEQAQGPVQAAVEMNSTPERTVRTLKSIPDYVGRFQQSFPGERDPVTFENMARAIEVFEATLLTPWSKFDRFLSGDEGALDAEERKGLTIFMDKGCVTCHSGVNLGGTGYFPFGVIEKPNADVLPREDRGRFEVTKAASDEFSFKSPSLRNIALTAPYFHSGKVWDLEQAVSIMGSAQLGAKLSAAESKSIVRFLHALTGLQPEVEYPVLPAHTAATPPPTPDGRRGSH